MVKNPPANAGDSGDMGLIPGLGRSPGGGNGNPFQYSYLENPMDRGAWLAEVHGVTKSCTRLSICAHSLYHHYNFLRKEKFLRSVHLLNFALRIEMIGSLLNILNFFYFF